MKVVLREDVETLGRKGDLLEVADGYARNYLVPRGLAIKATKGVVAQAEAMRRNREAREVRDRAAAQELADRLTGGGASRSRRAPARAGSCSARSPPPTSSPRCSSAPASSSTAAACSSTSRSASSARSRSRCACTPR